MQELVDGQTLHIYILMEIDVSYHKSQYVKLFDS